MTHTELNLGTINGHAVGRILKEAMRRAIVSIRAQGAAFEVYGKPGYGARIEDVFTSADSKAQEVYLRTLKECFPDCGVVAEEDQLSIAASGNCKAYFTVDPLDGTRAFIRRQSHGVGTMIALVEGDDVLSAYIGDINTDEMYGYRPSSNSVYRITRLDTFERLGYSDPGDLAKTYILLRDREGMHSALSQQLVSSFKSCEVGGGSIGIWMARLWKREVTAALMLPSPETPWDSTPIVGISRQLGYVFLRPTRDAQAWEIYHHPIAPEIWHRTHETLVIHENDLPSLATLCTIV